jgi:methionyl aminopeptidase
MITPLTYDDFDTMHVAGKVSAKILQDLEKFITPGITTKDIETFFDKELDKHPGMTAAFRGVNGYPASLCVSINEEIIHGIPSASRTIHEADVVSVDLGIKYKGLYVDTAYTYIASSTTSPAGHTGGAGARAQAERMIAVAKKALESGISRVEVGARIGDIGSAVQKVVEENKFSVIRKFVGHGIGRSLHCYPEVPNFGRPGEGELLEEGMAIAIEPMVSAGSYDIAVMDDGWTVKTKDNSLAVHFEHTIAITKDGHLVLT